MYSYSGRQYSGNWRMLRNCFHDFIPGWTLFQSRLEAFSVRKRTWCLGGLLITWRWIDQTQWTMPESDLPIGFMCLQDSVRTSHRLDISYFEDIVFGIGLCGKQKSPSWHDSEVNYQKRGKLEHRSRKHEVYNYKKEERWLRLGKTWLQAVAFQICFLCHATLRYRERDPVSLERSVT